MKDWQKDPFFKDVRPDGSIVTGTRGGTTHFHGDDLGTGVIKDQRTNKVITTVNTFNDQIDRLLNNNKK